MRIVSLLPSATEIVYALGLEDQLVGVARECDYPPSVRDLPKVTRTLIPTDASSGLIDHLVRERLGTNQALCRRGCRPPSAWRDRSLTCSGCPQR
jgi:iron complex transport system substrate-binding protein